MAIRIMWDEYEVALLLDYVIRIENGMINRQDAVSAVSDKLRNRAISKGLEIDDSFRNENGISMQMSALRNCYLGVEQGLSISKLFREIVALYRNDRVAFENILQEEWAQLNGTVWQEFLLWLKKTHPASEMETIAAISIVSAFGLKNKALNKPVNEIINEAEVLKIKSAVLQPKLFGVHSKKTAAKASKAIGLYYDFLCTRKPGITPSNPEKKIFDGQEIMEAEETVDFSTKTHYAHTKPVYCEYKKSSIDCVGWNALFINLVKAFYNDYADVFPIGKSLSASARVDIGDHHGMIYPKEIADGVFLECNVNATGVINKIHSLMSTCGIPQDDVIIRYRRSGQKDVQRAEMANSVKEKNLPWLPRYTKEVSQLLAEHYQYGFRVGSPIEMMRLRNYAESESIILPESDEDLDREIAVAGVLIDGKMFALSDALLNEVGSFVECIFSGGTSVVFTEVLMEKHLEWFEERLIISEDMLKAILRKSRPEYYFGQNIITSGEKISEHDAVVREIFRCTNDSRVVALDDLEKNLPYIPSDKIAWNLSASPEFVWISEGKYFAMKHFVVEPEDENAILEFVSSACERSGFASMADVPFGRIPDDNYELSVVALHAAVFSRILRGNYYIHGKIITKEPDGVDIAILLKSFCVEKDQCTVTEVFNRATELTGAINKQYSMEALYETMVRADAERFVAERQVSFDVERIDELLSQVIKNGFAPIRAISTFALFPACGISWNHYVLESFCYRFSNKYRLVVLNYNDKNAGIIKSKDLPLGYFDLLCEAAAATDVELTQERIGEYFFDCGFTAKRKYSSLPEIIERARIIREER